jgi:hypothetical protein
MCHWSSWLLSELNALVFIIITKRNPETWTIGKNCEKFAKWKVVLQLSWIVGDCQLHTNFPSNEKSANYLC